MSEIRKELLDRLICAKYIFMRGMEILDQGGPFSSGRSVLHFQDSAEMALRAIAEHLHCSVKPSTQFNQIVDSINESGVNVLSHRTALNQLNSARVNFKHFGLEPKIGDSNKFKNDLNGFFPNAIKDFMGIDFDSLSLTNLIGHRRTENHLNIAQKLINEG